MDVRIIAVLTVSFVAAAAHGATGRTPAENPAADEAKFGNVSRRRPAGAVRYPGGRRHRAGPPRQPVDSARTQKKSTKRTQFSRSPTSVLPAEPPPAAESGPTRTTPNGRQCQTTVTTHTIK